MAHHIYNTAAWRRVSRQVLNRDRHLCQIRYPGCRTYADTVDHIVGWDHGGSHFDMANLQAACRICNSKKRWRDGDQPYAPTRAW